MQLLDNFDSIFSWGHCRQQEGSLKLTLVQAEPHSMYHSNSTPLESLQYINAFPAPESSKMGKILQMQSNKCQTDGKDCFSKPVIYTPLIQSKTWLGFSAVRGYCWLMLNFSIRTATTFYRATSHLISTQPVLLYCLIHPRFRTLYFSFFKFMSSCQSISPACQRISEQYAPAQGTTNTFKQFTVCACS